MKNIFQKIFNKNNKNNNQNEFYNENVIPQNQNSTQNNDLYNFNNNEGSINTNILSDIDFELRQKEMLIKQIKEQYINSNTKDDIDNKYNNFLKSFAVQIPSIDFIQNNNILYIKNENRKEYIYTLDNLLNEYKLSYTTMSDLLLPFKDVISSIKKNNNQIYKKINKNFLQDLSLTDIINQTSEVLEKYEDYLVSVGEMYDKEFNIINSGLNGEEEVNNELYKYSNKLINIQNARFELNGLSVECDNIVLSNYGIFIIEVKNFSNRYKIKIEKNGEWKNMLHGFEERMVNVTEQINRHIKYTEEIINKELDDINFKNIKIIPLIVIANNNVQIINMGKIPVIKTNQIYDYIYKNESGIGNQTINIINKIIKKNMLPPKPYQIEDIRKYILNLIKYLNTNLTYYEYINSKLKELNNSINIKK